jgi:bacterioferritin-associated ferredoxin
LLRWTVQETGKLLVNQWFIEHSAVDRVARMLTRNILIAPDNANGYHPQSPSNRKCQRAVAMYICLCNGINDRDARRAAEAADGSVAQVYRGLGCAPKCGKCVPVMRELLDELAGGTVCEAAGA